MNKLNKAITINAPVHTVFDYVREPHNLLKLCSHLVTIDDVELLPNGCKNFAWEYKLLNVHFFGTSDIVDCDPHHYLSSHIQGGIKGRMTWIFQPDNASTYLTLIVEYRLPSFFLQKHRAKTIAQQNEGAVRDFLEALKTEIETTAAVH